MQRLTMTTRLPGTPESLFPFFAEAGNLGKITPPELGFRILSSPGRMETGALIDYRIGLWGLPLRWRTRIASWDPPHAFSDEQLRGPYALWHHTHAFAPDDADGTIMTDTVLYRLPLEPLSLPAAPLIRLQLRRIFAFRDRAMREALGLPPERVRPEIRFESL